MSNQLCACDAGIGNMGLSRCDKLFKAGKKFVYVPLYTNAGVENSINPATTLDAAWIAALINNADKSVRIFFTPELKNIKMPKDAPIMETFDDGSSNYVSDNVRKVTAELPECSPRLKAEVESVRCLSGVGVFIVDMQGNLIGCQKYSDGLLYPIAINPKSMYAGVMMAEDKTSQKLGIQFEIPNWFDDSTMCMISSKAFTDFSMLSVTGLINAKIVYSNIASGAVRATITTPSTDLYEETPIEGLVSADFKSSVTGTASKIRNTTNSADVSITTVTESAPGIYDFTYTLAASKVVVIYAELPGVDFANLKDKNYTTV